MHYSTIEVSYDGGVATVTLNRPSKLNALNKLMFTELKDVFARLRKDSNVGSAVLTGAGRAFCAGGDVEELRSGELVVDSFTEAREASKEFVLAVQSFEKPLIGAINGIAAGGGAGLVLMCDVVFAARQAAFSAIFRKIGMVPDCGVLYLLPRLVGPSRAKELVYSGRIIDAHEMFDMGIAQELVDGEDLLEKAMSYARMCAEGPSTALAHAKALIDRSYGISIEQFFDYESLSLPLVMHTPDYREGVTAFLEKREAKFGSDVQR